MEPRFENTDSHATLSNSRFTAKRSEREGRGGGGGEEGRGEGKTKRKEKERGKK